MALASVGLGTKTGEMSPENYAKYLKLIPVCSISFSFGTALAKCSFAVLYLRLIPNRYVQWLNRGIIFYVLCQAIEETFVNIFQCRPVAKAWDPSLEGTCINIETMWWFGVSYYFLLFFFISFLNSLFSLFISHSSRPALLTCASPL